ncbi:MAG: hypothetical protein GY940_19975 [bacterium]|nr:hypothetical protein [bacterium]
MDIEEFKQTLELDQPPSGVTGCLLSLWWDAKGDWTKAHKTAQEIYTDDGSWVHAYLHRKEGDEWNAGYWYNRAGKPHSRLSLEEEWTEIIEALL